MMRRSRHLLLGLSTLLWLVVPPVRAADDPIALGDRRELFVDRHLIGTMTGVRLLLHEPRDEGAVFRYDAPWEGKFCAYNTILHDGGKYRAYYRGSGKGELTCIAESADGIAWTKPKVGLVEVEGNRENNVILRAEGFSHNFSPFIDANPDARADQRYKALAGTIQTGLCAFVSADGLRWRKLREEPVITSELVKAAIPEASYMFDSQNVAFWSAAERRYVAYFRVFRGRYRQIARAESADLVTWKGVRYMRCLKADGADAPIEQLYTNQTHPYFRAPHLYVALPARFMPGRRAITEADAKALKVDPGYVNDASDAVFMTSRGEDVYNRTFLGSFIRPGIGPQNWVSRTNYPALNVVPTGKHEMSVYVNQDYAQPTSHLRRYSLRVDGFSSARAEYEGGELVTRPLTFKGGRLLLNFATSAAGGIRVEMQDAAGRPVPGFALADCVETIGNDIERPVAWKSGTDVSRLAGTPVRLRFVMKDTDLYALRFAE